MVGYTNIDHRKILWNVGKFMLALALIMPDKSIGKAELYCV